MTPQQDYLPTLTGSESGPFPNFYELGTLFCEILTVKNEHFCLKPSLNGICTGAGARKHNVLHAHCTDIEGVKAVRPQKKKKKLGVT